MCTYPVTETDLEDWTKLPCEFRAIPGVMLAKQEQTTKHWDTW